MKSMSTFDETKHDRDAAGKFTEMSGDEQTDSLAPAPAPPTTAETLMAAFNRESEAAWERIRALREPAVQAITEFMKEKYPAADRLHLCMDGDESSEWVSVEQVYGVHSEAIDLDLEDEQTINEALRSVVTDESDLKELPTAYRVAGTGTFALPIPRETPDRLRAAAEDAFFAAVNRGARDNDLAGAALRSAAARLYPDAEALVFDMQYDEDARLGFSGVRGGEYEGAESFDLPSYDDVDDIVFSMSGGGYTGQSITGIEHVDGDTYIFQLKG